MGFGLGHLRLSPAAFWAMTPRELAAAARAVRGPPHMGAADMGAALDRGGLAALMARFPDLPSRR